MGNENSQQNPTDNKSKSKSMIMQRKQKPQKKTYDEFFINHHKIYSLSHTLDVSTINPKRLVFISLAGLFKSWKHCPSISLYNAIIIMPLKKVWIEQPNKYQFEDADMLQDIQFLALLRWKDHQKLAIFMLDDDDDDDEIAAYDNRNIIYDEDTTSTSTRSSTDESHTAHSDSKESSKKSETPETYNNSNNLLISIVWRRLSLRLQELHDPIGNNEHGKYNPLIFNEKFWKRRSSVCKNHHNNKLFQNMTNLHMTEYCTNADDILLELYTVTMKFNTIKNLLTESNPTLEVITNYYDTNKMGQTNNIVLYPAPNAQKQNAQKKEIINENNNIHIPPANKVNNTEIEMECKYIEDEVILEKNGWWISRDYYDDSTLLDDTQALKEFNEYKNQFESPTYQKTQNHLEIK